jgi:hypothetical protein
LKKIKIPLIMAGAVISIGFLKGQSLASVANDDTQPQTQVSSTGGRPGLKVTGYLREPRFWVSPEYVSYWQNATPALPDMLDISTAAGTIGSQVYNQQRVTYGNGNAVRLTLGGWIDADEKYGVELSGFYTPKESETDSFTGSPGGSLLAAPLVDFATGTLHNAQLGGTTSTGVQGVATFKSTTESYSGEGNLLVHLADFSYHKQLDVDVSGLGGFRYFGLSDEFQEGLSRQIVGPNPGGRANFSTNDDYQAQNNFYGANFGTHVRANYNGFFAELTPKLGLGLTDEAVDVSGSASTSVNGGAPGPVNPGGFLAIGNKLGTRSTDKFAVLPEVTLKLGYDIKNRVEFFVGYDLLYLSEVARANGQVPSQVDAATSPIEALGGVPGAVDNSPAPTVSSTSFFEQGVTAGVTAKF